MQHLGEVVAGMNADRVKNLFLLVVLAGWAATVGTTIAKGGIPDAPLLGVPGAVWLLLHPPRIGGRDEPTPQPAVDPPPAPAAGTGGTP